MGRRQKTTVYNALDQPTSVVVTDKAPQSGQSTSSSSTTAQYDIHAYNYAKQTVKHAEVFTPGEYAAIYLDEDGGIDRPAAYRKNVPQLSW